MSNLTDELLSTVQVLLCQAYPYRQDRRAVHAGGSGPASPDKWPLFVNDMIEGAPERFGITCYRQGSKYAGEYTEPHLQSSLQAVCSSTKEGKKSQDRIPSEHAKL